MEDIRLFILIKLLLIFFVFISIYLFYKKKSPYIFLSLVGTISALSYALLVDNHSLLFWGLQGDELTIGAMFKVFSKGTWSDFAYHDLPPFYPPGFFLVFWNNR